jgi:hypothetical protein
MELGVPLKSSDTIRPVIDILSDRHPKFAVALNKYTNGGNTPHDCAATLEQMFSDIEAACHSIERSVGPQIWQAQTHAHSAAQYDRRYQDNRRSAKGSKGMGKGAKGGKGKGKGQHNAHSSEVKGKGAKGSKGKGASYQNNNTKGTCTAAGCRASSGRFMVDSGSAQNVLKTEWTRVQSSARMDLFKHSTRTEAREEINSDSLTSRRKGWSHLGITWPTQ